jgi:hypothetical protein
MTTVYGGFLRPFLVKFRKTALNKAKATFFYSLSESLDISRSMIQLFIGS